MQKLRFSRYFKIIFISIDILLIWAEFTFFLEQKSANNFSAFFTEPNVTALLILALFWLLLSGRTKLYSVARNLTFTIYLERLVTHLFIFIVGVALLGKINTELFLEGNKFIFAIVLGASFIILKSSTFFALKSIRTFGFNHRNIMFLQENEVTRLLKNTFEKRKDYGFKFFNFNETFNLEKLIFFWKTNGIHTLFLPAENSGFTEQEESQLFLAAEEHNVRIALIPNVIQNNFTQYNLEYVEMQPILIQAKFPLDYTSNYVLKRATDLIFSLLFLIFVGIWLFPIIAILIKLDSKGPVIFSQKRYGYDEEVFHCLKFRSMNVNPHSSEATTAKNDIRITKIGRFLRRSSLDETPQFINVLKGEMSLVGPRPHMLLVDDYFKNKIHRYSLRSEVKPGITGLAQVNGLRGDGENVEIEMTKRILADSFYVKNWTLSLDLVIIFKTLLLLLKGDKNAR